MRFRTTSCLLFLLAPFALQAADDIPAATLWNRIDELQKAPEPKPENDGQKAVLTRGYLEAGAQRGAAIGDLLLEFVTRYPQDSRHWEAVVALAKLDRPVYEKLGDVRNEGWNAVVHDQAAENAWNAQVNAFVDQLVAATGVPAALREEGVEHWVDASRAAVGETPDASRATALREFRRRIDAQSAEYPQSMYIQIHEWQYIHRLRLVDPRGVKPYLEALFKSPNVQLAQWAHGEANTEALRHTPIELKFTALDGREVDMKKLRGKVVLVDFWATWCGPCVAQLPNVKAVYDKFHQRGFEVVGISQDKQDDRQKLADFVASHGYPWPQCHDSNLDVTNKYGIVGIPAMFLFDKKGLLVTTDAEGEKLEPEVVRQLGRRG